MRNYENMLSRIFGALILVLCIAVAVQGLKVSSSLPGCDDAWSFVVLSDIHIGDANAQKAIDLATGAVKHINAIAKQQNIKWVFITGDVTNTAYPNQWKTFAKIFSNLQVRWLPLLGNHDVWQYNSTWEEPYPTGDNLFGTTLAAQLQDKTLPSVPGVQKFWYNTQPVFNPEWNITSWFQNWELHYCGLHFFANDFNARKAALSQLGYKGSWPGVEMHNFPGGTYQWLRSSLQALNQSSMPVTDASIVLMQHHPFRAPVGVPDFIYGWSGSQKKVMRAMFQDIFPVEKYWGVIAGHWHRWFNGTSFDEWPSFRQWETNACKLQGSITLAPVQRGSIGQLQKLDSPYS